MVGRGYCACVCVWYYNIIFKAHDKWKQWSMIEDVIIIEKDVMVFSFAVDEMS